MVNFGIIGCGKIGTRHVSFLKNMDGVKIRGVCDIVGERANQIAKELKIKSYVNYKELLMDQEIDIVNICTPSGLHAIMSIDALKSGKHVICEKPMALKNIDAENMITAAQESGKKLFIVKQNRYNTPIKTLKAAIDKGRFGKVYSIISNIAWNRHDAYYEEAEWRGTKELDGGALATQASHFLDMMQWFGGDVESVYAKTSTFNHNIETEDTGAIILKYKSGAIGTMYYTTCIYNKNMEGSITVLGTKGTAKIGGEYLNKIEWWNVEGYPLPENTDETAPANDYGSYRGSASKHDYVFREAIKKVIGDENSFVVDGYEGKKSVEIIEAVHRSAETGQEVFLPLK